MLFGIPWVSGSLEPPFKGGPVLVLTNEIRPNRNSNPSRRALLQFSR